MAMARHGVFAASTASSPLAGYEQSYVILGGPLLAGV